MTSKTQINEYLFYEFGLDLDDAQAEKVVDDWPFQLTYLETISLPDEDVEAFQFTSEGEDYFALSGSSLYFYPTEGMDIRQLRFQLVGSKWISARSPIDLNTSRIGDERVPTTLQRRQAIVEMAQRVVGNSDDLKILEGLFFPDAASYVALVRTNLNGQALIVGTNLQPYEVAFPDASDWRRLSLGVGALIEAGKLPPR